MKEHKSVLISNCLIDKIRVVLMKQRNSCLKMEKVWLISSKPSDLGGKGRSDIKPLKGH